MAKQPPAEITITHELVRTLLRAQAPSVAERDLSLFASGWDNEQWALGDDLLVRLPRRALAAPLITNEHAALPLIADLVTQTGMGVPVPTLRGAPQGAYPWPWSLTPRFTGESALHSAARVNDAWAARVNDAWAARLGATLRALHVPAPLDAPRNPWRGHPLSERAERTQPMLAACVPEHRAVLSEAWAKGVRADPFSDSPVWIHGDLHPGNLIVNEGDLVALIDFGDVTAGDPAYDLGVAWMTFTAVGRDRLRSAYDVDGATWARAQAWAAAFAAIVLTRSDDAPDYLALGERIVTELATEL